MSGVLGTFSVLSSHVKLKVSQDSATIDNIVFRLHYRATFLVLMIGCLMGTSRQFIGEHIKCMVDNEKDSLNHVINQFCFFTSTFTVSKYMNPESVQLGHAAHPGVGPYTDDDKIVYHAYYQWVPFFLFFQAILFYIPHHLWRKEEGGRLKMLVSGLSMASLSLQDEELDIGNGKKIPSKEHRRENIRTIRTAFLNRLHVNRPWAYYLGFCEVLNFINVLTQIYVTNWFLGGAFLGLGPRIAGYGIDAFNQNMSPLDAVFPKVTKCTFHKYGPSGTIQKHDALCVMALNIVNEKIYIFLWYWFIILAIITGLALIWRILTMVLHSRSVRFNRFIFSIACPGKYNPWNVLRVTHEYHFGDWLFLYYIAKNLDNYVFKELLEQLAHDMEDRRMSRLKQGLVETLDEEDLLKKA